MKTYPYLVLTALFALASCSEKQEATENHDKANTGELESFILKTAPENAQPIYTTRESAKPGDTITVHGKVMGSKDVFVPGRAILQLGDPETITSCDLKGDDHCTTPWDVCCDDPDTVKESTLTVQVVDADGNLIKSGLKGVSGIKELSELVVTGKVAEGSNEDNLMLNATGIYVKP